MKRDELIQKLRELPEDTVIRVWVGYDSELYPAEALIPHTDGTASLV